VVLARDWPARGGVGRGLLVGNVGGLERRVTMGLKTARASCDDVRLGHFGGFWWFSGSSRGWAIEGIGGRKYNSPASGWAGHANGFVGRKISKGNGQSKAVYVSAVLRTPCVNIFTIST
jgi:hypothetical protein